MKPLGSWEAAPKRSSTKSRRGYTAMELVMGLLVGLVLTGMAIPQVQSGLYTYRLKGATANSVWAGHGV